MKFAGRGVWIGAEDADVTRSIRGLKGRVTPQLVVSEMPMVFCPQPKPRPRKVQQASERRAVAKAHRAVYAAVTARDVGCRVCGRMWGLHRHHLIFRSKGGATTTANVVLLCDFHHTDVHAHRLTISGDADGVLMWVRKWT